MAGEDANMLDVKQGKPKRRLMGIKCFTCIGGIITALYISSQLYFLGAVRMLEKQYGFSTTTTGFFNVADNISSVPFLLVFGYIGDKINKARIIGFSALVLSLSSFLHALPYFVDTKRSSDAGVLTNLSDVANVTYHPGKLKDMLCEMKAENNTCSIQTTRVTYDNSVTFGIIVVARLLFGSCGSIVFPLAQAYLYENLGNIKVSTYTGVLSSMISVGQITGLGIAAFCTRIPIDLKDYSLSPKDPRFLGAWWLGFIILGVGFLVFAFPMFFFPPTLAPMSRSYDTEIETTKRRRVLGQIKEAVHDVRRLLSNYLYLLFVATYCLAMYTVIAMAMNMQRYIEVYFRVPIYKANLITALSGAGTGFVGSLIGGFVTSRFSLRTSRVALLNLIVIVLITIAIGGMMSLKCEQVTYAGSSFQEEGNKLNLTTTCSAGCDCDLSVSQPVCGTDGHNYFTPCHGGCVGRHGNNLTGCSCIPGGVALIGLCETTCDHMITYIIILGLLSVLVGFSIVPRNIIMLRVAPARQKTFAMGFNSFFYNLFGFIPGPVIFGKLVDSTCLIWQQKCGQRGSCMLYDTDSLRNLIHGAGIGINVVGSILIFIGWRLITTRERKEEDKGVEEEYKGAEGSENEERHVLDNKAQLDKSVLTRMSFK